MQDALDLTQYAPSQEELSRLNWPALVIPWLWCFYHQFYLLGFLGLIPGVNFFVRIYLLFRGNRLDWEKNMDAGVERYRSRRKTWGNRTAIVFMAVIAAAFIGGVHEYVTHCFSWQDRSFKNGAITLSLPFELEEDAPDPPSGTTTVSMSYSGSNSFFDLSLQYTELNPDYEYNPQVIRDETVDGFRKNAALKAADITSATLEYQGHPAMKISLTVQGENDRRKFDLLYIFPEPNKCWHMKNSYAFGDDKSAQASLRVFESIKLRDVGENK